MTAATISLRGAMRLPICARSIIPCSTPVFCGRHVVWSIFRPWCSIQRFSNTPFCDGDITLLNRVASETPMGGRRVFRTRSAQSAMEYLLVVSFAFIILTLILVIAYSESSRFALQVSTAQIQRAGGELVDAINTVYYAGSPTKKTMQLQFPKHLRGVRIENNTIVFEMLGESGVYEYAVEAYSNVTGSIHPNGGLHVLTIEAIDDSVRITET